MRKPAANQVRRGGSGSWNTKSWEEREEKWVKIGWSCWPGWKRKWLATGKSCKELLQFVILAGCSFSEGSSVAVENWYSSGLPCSNWLVFLQLVFQTALSQLPVTEWYENPFVIILPPIKKVARITRKNKALCFLYSINPLEFSPKLFQSKWIYLFFTTHCCLRSVILFNNHLNTTLLRLSLKHGALIIFIKFLISKVGKWEDPGRWWSTF